MTYLLLVPPGLLVVAWGVIHLMKGRSTLNRLIAEHQHEQAGVEYAARCAQCGKIRTAGWPLAPVDTAAGTQLVCEHGACQMLAVRRCGRPAAAPEPAPDTYEAE